MACIDPTIWQQAVASCTLSKGYAGLGAPNYVRTGMRGLGASLSISAPASVQQAMNFLVPNTPGGVVAPPAPPNQAPAKPSAPTGIKTNVPAAPAGSMNDPCSIAAQAPCANMGVCPPGSYRVSPAAGIAACVVGTAPSTTPVIPMTAVMTPQVAAPMTTTTKVAIAAGVGVGGFILWKLLAH